MHIGVDIEDISRFKNKTVETSSEFLNRIFTQNELEYCFKYKDFACHLAARYCAKEATVKAFSNIYHNLIPYNKIEILNNPNGSPYINLYIDELKEYSISVSLSHEREKAIAFVVVSKWKKSPPS